MTNNKTQRSSAWQERDYRWWFVGDTANDLGASIRAFAWPLIALDISQSDLTVGTIMGTVALIRTLATVAGGILVDSFDRRLLTLIYTVSGVILYTALVIALSIGLLRVELLFAFGVLIGLRSGLFATLTSVTLPQVVRSEHLPVAISSNQARDATLSLGGAPLAGAVYQLSRVAALIAEAVGAMILLVATWNIRKPLGGGAHKTPSPQEKPSFRRLLRTPGVAVLLVVSSFQSALINAFLLITILQLRKSGTAPWLIGLVESGLGIGMLMGALLSPILMKRFSHGRLISWSYMLCTLAFALTPIIDSPFGFMAVTCTAALLIPVGSAIGGTFIILQAGTGDLGQVYAYWGTFQGLVLAAISALAGMGLEYLGFHSSVIILSLLFVVILVVIVLNPSLRRLRVPLSS